jgi:hypothetical protein
MAHMLTCAATKTLRSAAPLTILTGLCNRPLTYNVVQSSKSVHRASVEMIPYFIRTVSDSSVSEVDEDDVDEEESEFVAGRLRLSSLTSTSVTNHTPPPHSCTLAIASGPNHLNNLG